MAPATPPVDLAAPEPRVTDDETERALAAGERASRAEIVLSQGDVARALALSAEAMELDPSMAEYLALHGYLQGLSGPEGLSAGLDELDQAISRDAYIARAYHWRGILHRRLDNEESARLDFARAAELDPKMIDAQREVRASLLPTAGTADRTGAHGAAKTGAHGAVKPAGRAIDLQKVLVVAGALAVVIGFGVGATAVNNIPSAPQQSIRGMLVRSDVAAIDAMGVTGAAQIALLLDNSSKASALGHTSERTFRQLANEYLLHYASTVDRRPPPEVALKPDQVSGSELKNAWLDWLAHA